MEIIRCHIENFGRLSDITFNFREGYNGLCCDNGWGKSTLASFICVMFYGFEGERRRKDQRERERYRPWQGGVYGGSITFSADDRYYTVTRIFGRTEKEDRFTLYDEIRKQESADFSRSLGRELFGIDRESFRRTVYIGQNECMTGITGDISGKIGQISEEAGDIGDYDRAAEGLRKKISRMSPDRATGSIRKKKERAASMAAELRQKEYWEKLAESLQEEADNIKKQCRTLASQIDDVAAEQKIAADNMNRIAENKEKEHLLKRYREQQERCISLERELKAAEEYFTEGIPDREQMDELTDCTMAYLEMKSAAEALKPSEMEVRLAALSEKPKEQNDEKRKYAAAVAAGTGIVMLIAGFILRDGEGMILAMAGTAAIIAGAAALYAAGKNSRYGRAPGEVSAAQKKVEDYRKKKEEADRLDDRIREISSEMGIGMSCSSDEDRTAFLAAARESFLKYRNMEKILAEERRILEEIGRPVAEISGMPEEKCCDAAELGKRAEKLQKAYAGCLEKENQIWKKLVEAEEKADEMRRTEEELSALENEIEEDLTEYRITCETARILEEAKESFTARYSTPVRDAFDRYYGIITGKEPESRIDADGSLRIREMGLERDTESFSAGCRDLMGFCLRMAFIEVMYPDEKPVIVLDDPFVNLDDRNLRGAAELLKTISEEYQIIYFTCSEYRKQL